MKKEVKKRWQEMTSQRLLEIEEKLRLLAERGAPSIIPAHLVTDAIARKMAQIMVDNPLIPDGNYTALLAEEEFSYVTAYRTVKRARVFALKIKDQASAPAVSEPMNNHEGEAQ
jgi:hypothetical protein